MKKYRMTGCVLLCVLALAAGACSDDDDSKKNPALDAGADVSTGDAAGDAGSTDTSNPQEDTGSTPDGGSDAGDEDATADTGTQQPEFCAENERVEAGACVACADGKVSPAGADASGPDTVCGVDDACFATLGVDCDTYQEAYLKADTQQAGAYFGMSVAMSDDEQTLFVGEPARLPLGAVYVFERDGSTWAQSAVLKPDVGGGRPNGTGGYGFGVSVDVDGDTLVVGDSLGGLVHVYTGSGDTWTAQATLTSSNFDDGDLFGGAIALSGDTLVVGAMTEKSDSSASAPDPDDNTGLEIGAAYVFERNGSDWTETHYIKPPNPTQNGYFGSNVDLDGDTMVISSAYESSGATGIGGDMMDTSAAQSGAVFVYGRSGSDWTLEHYIKASNAFMGANFGSSLHLSGDRLVVGATREGTNATGAAYVFTRTGGTWTEEAYIKASHPLEQNSQFGSRVALDADGDLLAVAAVLESGAGLGLNPDPSTSTASLRSGAVFLYERDASGTWSPLPYMKAPNAGNSHYYGTSLACSGSGQHLFVGAAQESGGAVGVNGDMTDQSASRAGAVYVNRVRP
ncbi:hypothetical protein FIV42_01265 [Persicimonas caeni]|uniref:Integrin n=1 Tax=Persicimonas caeni TaxID=2292766 RepID=A0A4Y6PMG7_PERCE|nr:hypothetical protein [Persicimonas caeni]QDG49413.1 hypothetical protein FIV42_01265 [Persicimonas caeni]QED30634.1 hypothetical protein FRD00_01260 [Persicimonas caeni]